MRDIGRRVELHGCSRRLKAGAGRGIGLPGKPASSLLSAKGFTYFGRAVIVVGAPILTIAVENAPPVAGTSTIPLPPAVALIEIMSARLIEPSVVTTKRLAALEGACPLAHCRTIRSLTELTSATCDCWLAKAKTNVLL